MTEEDILSQDEDETYRHMLEKKKVLDMELKLDKALDLTLISLAEGIKSQQVDSGIIIFNLYSDISEEIANAIDIININDEEYKKKITDFKKMMDADEDFKKKDRYVKEAIISKFKFGLVVAAVHKKTKNKRFTGKVGV